MPSGRLNIQDNETKKIIEAKFKPPIGIIEDPQNGVGGPVWGRGGIPVESADGKIFEVRNRVTLCRCGKSKINLSVTAAIIQRSNLQQKNWRFAFSLI